VELLLLNWTRRGDLVIDPYNGSGTTTAVAQRLGRRFLGIDVSRDYCAQARARLAGTNGRAA
jgi:DNA modification methylase